MKNHLCGIFPQCSLKSLNFQILQPEDPVSYLKATARKLLGFFIAICIICIPTWLHSLRYDISILIWRTCQEVLFTSFTSLMSMSQAVLPAKTNRTSCIYITEENWQFEWLINETAPMRAFNMKWKQSHWYRVSGNGNW